MKSRTNPSQCWGAELEVAEKTGGHRADIEVGIGSEEEKSIVCCGALQSEYRIHVSL